MRRLSTRPSTRVTGICSVHAMIYRHSFRFWGDLGSWQERCHLDWLRNFKCLRPTGEPMRAALACIFEPVLASHMAYALSAVCQRPMWPCLQAHG